MRKKLLTGALALALGFTTVFSGVTPATVRAAETTTTQAASDYVYCYAGLTWAEYWANEGVYRAGNDASSSVKDNCQTETGQEYDKGAFDAVTRATLTHGPHRASFQSIYTIYDTNEKSYKVSYWDENKTGYLAEAVGTKTSFTLSNNTLTFNDGTTATYSKSVISGLKYVPVAVKKSDYAAFKNQYDVVENGGTLTGGYTEKKLVNYTNLTANVTANTNGLKIATKQSNGSFKFSARKTGTDSGVSNATLIDPASLSITPAASTTATAGSKKTGYYGDFIRVDITGDDYGTYASKMQTAEWTYYGNDSTYTKPLKTYGTKLAADNWMHSSQGLQFALTDSYRCHLPKGTDGTGYWQLTIYALGYKDYTYKFQATAENINSANIDDTSSINTSNLKTTITSTEAKNFKQSDYTTASWSAYKSALAAAKEIVNDPDDQLAVDDALADLNAAVKGLTKAPTTAKKTNTTTLKKGAKVTDKSSKAVYKVTGANTVEYTKPSSKKATSASVPATIKANGKTYKVTSIAAKAFYKNTKLKKVTIGSNIKKIGKQAFFGCKNLKKITIKTKSLKKSTVGSKAFKGINKKATIKVPKKQKKAYKKILKAKGIGSKVKVK